MFWHNHIERRTEVGGLRPKGQRNGGGSYTPITWDIREIRFNDCLRIAPKFISSSTMEL
jgi:hypothetical protein